MGVSADRFIRRFWLNLRPVSGEPRGRFGDFFVIVTVETSFLPASRIGRVADLRASTSIATHRRVMQVESQPDPTSDAPTSKRHTHRSVTRRVRLKDRGTGGRQVGEGLIQADSSDQAPGDLACSSGGYGGLFVLRRIRYGFGPNPKPDSQIRRPDELNSCIFKCAPNLLHGVKVGFDTTFRAFQPAYRRKSQSGFPGKLTLPPSQEGASCLDLSRVNEHLRPHRCCAGPAQPSSYPRRPFRKASDG
jgi:hypothetical protein